MWAFIPREILKLTAPASVRMGFSYGYHVTILAAFLNACKADLDSFPLSYATSYRKQKEIVEEIYDDTREKFRSDC